MYAKTGSGAGIFDDGSANNGFIKKRLESLNVKTHLGGDFKDGYAIDGIGV